ncbi:mannose-6-phosphate isomerase [Iocasia frigidifontis]|uniref:Phosphohexomutase n=1 Tax=Iocasia fonsfrigidae TaxID=2682810 RepID=A0A8A7KDL8_9FIRM|nr:type I phosphomannose isomerase catalytic subunit [Iocasia fonsfrigidae]QTL99360.1 mannose-6-phosphate isomerase [Iocasia fonsfrigidae]
MCLYPLLFNPVYKEKIWGGNKIRDFFDRDITGDKIGESWEIAAHKKGMSIIANGEFAGKSFQELLNKYPVQLLGKRVSYQEGDSFPLLVKLLDANDKLSVQVHPDDNYARENEAEQGKTEMWYIIDAEPAANLIYGVKPGISREGFSQAIEKGTLEKYLCEIEVKTGDFFFIPSGTLHAIEEGILLAEIQQNSDTTYRVYDWNRKGQDGKPRDLHIKKALDVIDFAVNPFSNTTKSLLVENQNYSKQYLSICPYFAVEKYDVCKKFTLNPAGKSFYILMNITGKGEIGYDNKSFEFDRGMTYFIPASLKNLTISGQLEAIVCYIPPSKEDIITALLQEGFSREEIARLAGFNYQW